ncbi:MAG: hypothetical protein ACFFDE_11435 [Promethearchaeota archaeon]
MVGILIAAALTTGIVFPLIYLFWRASKTSTLTILPFLFQLPMSLVLNLTVKPWLNTVIVGLGLPMQAMLLLLLFVAPFTEEAIKLAGLSLLFLRHFTHHDVGENQGIPAWRWLRTMGVMSGMGFGVGEIWAVAVLVVLYEPLLAVYPWFFYQGFIIERFEVVFIHGLFSLVSYWGYRRWLPATYLAAVGLHATLNASIILYQLGLLPAMHLSLYVTLFCVISLAVIITTLTAKDHHKRRHSQLETADKPVTTEKVKRQPEDRIVRDAKDNSDEAQD